MSHTLLINPTAFEAGLQAAFDARSSSSDAQSAAFARFTAQRLPNRRVEGWKWSDFHAALGASAPTSANDDVAREIAPSPFAALNPLEFRIVNGRIELPAGGMPDGVQFGVIDASATIAELDDHPLVSLNISMTRKALGIEIEEGVRYERPILIRHINSGGEFAFEQTLLRLGVGAHAHIIESFEGDGAGFASHLCHIAMRDNAHLKRSVFVDVSAQNVNHSIFAAKLDEGARLEQTSLSLGGKLSRAETIVHFVGRDASASINSASLLSGERHQDFTSHVQHKAESCEVRQIHKGVAKDRGRNVFQGKFHVEREAQKTDAKMTANALLLSDNAEANHKPELEIYADDVECAHGSTAGALDDDALFYLMQRGLDENAARGLLIEAFVGEVIDAIEDEAMREIFAAKVQNWLEAS